MSNVSSFSECFIIFEKINENCSGGDLNFQQYAPVSLILHFVVIRKMDRQSKKRWDIRQYMKSKNLPNDSEADTYCKLYPGKF